MFIGRKAEIDALTSKFSSCKRTAILLYGRRRVGKTALLREALKSVVKKDESYIPLPLKKKTITGRDRKNVNPDFAAKKAVLLFLPAPGAENLHSQKN